MAEPTLRSQRSFPIRPKPRPGEATIGYLTRVAAANAHGSLGQLFSAVPVGDASRAEQAMRLLGLQQSERAMLCGPLPAAWGGGTLPLQLSASQFNGVLRRWCSACLAEDGYVRWQWTLKLMCVCVRHGAWLQETCDACGAQQRWGPSLLDRCACRRDLTCLPRSQASERVLKLAERLLGEVVSSDWFCSLTSAEWHRAVLYLGQFSETATPLRPGQVSGLHRLSVAAALMSNAAELLGDWPTSFFALLRRLQQQATRQPSLQRTFHPLYPVLYRHLRSSAFDFLREAFEDYLHQNWWGMVCRRNRRMAEATQASHPRRTVPQAARIAGVAQSLADRLIQADLIGIDAAPLPSGRTARTLHARDVERLRSLATGSVTLHSAARELRLPECRVRQLLQARVLAPLVSRVDSPSAASWVISRAAMVPLLALSSSAASDQSVSVRAFLRYGHLAQAEAVEFVRSVIAGELREYAPHREMVALGDVQLSRLSVRAWIAGLRRAEGQALTLDEAATRLRLKQQVVYGLAHARLLSTYLDSSGVRRVSPLDVENFKRTYVSLAELARGSGVSSIAMLRQLPVCPVCGPTIDGSRQYFFRRSDVTSDGPAVSLVVHSGANRDEEGAAHIRGLGERGGGSI